MTSPRTKSILTIFTLLILLALISATATITSRIGFASGRQGFPGNQPPGGGNFQGNNGNNDFGNRTGNFQNNDVTSPRRNNLGLFSVFGIMRTLGLGGQAFVYINLGFAIAGIAFLLLSAFGVWKQKRWGLNLAMVLAVFVLIGALPGLFTIGGRFINYWRIAQNLFDTGASVVILFLGILPSVRDSVS